MEHAALTLGIVGWPLAHSLSPVLHAYFMDSLGLSGTYTPYPCHSNELISTVHSCQHHGLQGLNVTLPHKAAAFALAQHTTPTAQLAKAANTLRFEADHTITAHNTDISGFLASLPGNVRTQLPETHVIIIGAGGVAQAVVAALHYFPLLHLSLVSRSQERASTVMALAQRHQQQHNTPVTWHPWPETNTPILPKSDSVLAINATPLGMETPYPEERQSQAFLPILGPYSQQGSNKNVLALDTVYHASSLTGFCATAHQLGLPHQDGLAMLVHQGADSFTFWTGHTIGHELRQNALLYLRKQGLKAKSGSSE